jgi:hypothetical protein
MLTLKIVTLVVVVVELEVVAHQPQTVDNHIEDHLEMINL